MAAWAFEAIDHRIDGSALRTRHQGAWSSRGWVGMPSVAQVKAADLGDEFLRRVGVVAEALAVHAGEAVGVAGPVAELVGQRKQSSPTSPRSSVGLRST